MCLDYGGKLNRKNDTWKSQAAKEKYVNICT